MKSLIVLIMLICITMLFSCTTMDTQKEKPKMVQNVDIASPMIPQMETAKRIEIEGPKELFTFSLREADIRDVLKAIAMQTNYNMVIEPNVTGTCTVDLKNVTLTRALEYILEPLNYTFKIEERTIYVSKPKLETRFFRLNYITLKKIGTSSVTGTGAGGGGTSTTGTTGTTGAGAGGTGGGGGGTGTLINLQSLSETDLWGRLDENIKAFLSEDGRYTINSQASVVMVMDYPKNIKNIARFLETIEGTIQRQVVIEVKVIEVTLTEDTQEGINWAAINTKWLGGGFALNIEQALVAPQTRYFNIPRIYDAYDPANFSVPGNYFRFGVAKGKFDAFIDLLKTKHNIKFISSPQISTLNNQRAVIKVAQDDVYFEYSSTTGTTATTAGYTTKFVTVGLILDVTPQIDSHGNIIMNIHPVLTDKVAQVEMPVTAESKAEGSKSYVPVLAVREVDTVVKAREGDTIIIGGLIQDKSDRSDVGVSGISDVPLIGRLFKSKKTQTNKTELVIFLTPKIVYGKEDI